MSDSLKPVSPEALARLAAAAERRRERYPSCGGLRQSDGARALRRVAELEKRVAELERLLAEQQEAQDA